MIGNTSLNFNKRLSTLGIFQNSAAMRFHDRSDGAVPDNRMSQRAEFKQTEEVYKITVFFQYFKIYY